MAKTRRGKKGVNRGRVGNKIARNKIHRRRSSISFTKIIELEQNRIDRMDQKQRALANAERRAVAAEREYEAAQEVFASRDTTAGERAWLAELWATVEIRRAELEECRRMMVESPASAEHRGVRSFRPVPARRDSGV